jgi:hypothetical protein
LALVASAALAFQAPASPAATSVLDLQARSSWSAPAHYAGHSSYQGWGGIGPEGEAVTASLLNLNPAIGVWYLLKATKPGSGGEAYFHLEAPISGTSLRLGAQGLEVAAPDGRRIACDIFNSRSESSIAAISERGDPYADLCGNLVFLRLGQKGAANGKKERWANRARAWKLGGIVDWYKDTLKEDDETTATVVGENGKNPQASAGPRRAEVNAAVASQELAVQKIDVELEGEPKGLLPGAWYRLANQAAIYFSLVRIGDADPELVRQQPGLVDPLSPKLKSSLAYMVAFDLSQVALAWSHGTNFPGVGNSSKIKGASGPGPDGFGTLDPLQMSGLVNPAYFGRVLATMCGGFQREHGVQLGGPHAGQYNGFMQEGVLLSRMNSGLATVVMYKNGDVDIHPWGDDDEARIADIRYARQNGMPLIELNPRTGAFQPGAYVRESMSGYANWSGRPKDRIEAGETQRASERAAACVAENDGRRYLLYGYFALATPSSMALALQAYGCRGAIHLDMNSAEQAYMGILSRSGDSYRVEHPVAEMKELDGRESIDGKNRPVPWYVAEPTQADFFYVMQKR